VNESTKKAIGGIGAAIVIGAAASGIAYYAGTAQAYVAKVDGQAITSSQFDKLFAQTKKQYASRFGVDFNSPQGKSVEADMRKGIVDQLIDKQVIKEQVQARHVQVADADVNAKLAEIKKGFPTEDAFNKALSTNNMTLSDLKDAIHDGLGTQALAKDVTKDTVVGDADVAAYYQKNAAQFKQPEEIQASHILVKDPALAKKILAQLKSGGNFAALAKQYSEDPGSKVNGGDLGFFGHGRMVPAFEKVAFALQPGQISDIVHTQFGYHILKGGARHAPHVQALSEVATSIKQRLTQEREQGAFKSWLQAQRKTVKIEYKPGFDPAAAPGAAPILDDPNRNKGIVRTQPQGQAAPPPAQGQP
jgi:parvulin-like peptidyl-prolyl isomerase